MAIDYVYLQALNAVLKELARSPVRAACLSYPDLIVTEDRLAALYGADLVASLLEAPDLSKLLRWHGLKPEFGKIYDTPSLFDKIGISADFFDRKVMRGPEKIIDLNEALPETYHSKYDLVIDCGTLEHCFNVGAAFKAMCQLVSVGGYIITTAPMTAVNHGFWNFSPGTYLQGFEDNGFEVAWIRGRVREKDGTITIIPWEAPLARRPMPAESNLICVAKKLVEQPFKWPLQKKYQ